MNPDLQQIFPSVAISFPNLHEFTVYARDILKLFELLSINTKSTQ